MNNIVLGISVLALMIVSSCKKDYECHCETDDGDKTEDKKITEAKEDEAKNECENFEITLNAGNHDHDDDGEEDHHYHCHLD